MNAKNQTIYLVQASYLDQLVKGFELDIIDQKAPTAFSLHERIELCEREVDPAEIHFRLEDPARASILRVILI